MNVLLFDWLTKARKAFHWLIHVFEGIGANSPVTYTTRIVIVEVLFPASFTIHCSLFIVSVAVH